MLARALADQAVVLEYAAPLLGLGGSLVDWRGRRAAAQERAAGAAAAELGLELVAFVKVDPFPAARDHHLHVFEKVTETPARFPRRAGIARKRPRRGPGRQLTSSACSGRAPWLTLKLDLRVAKFV